MWSLSAAVSVAAPITASCHGNRGSNSSKPLAFTTGTRIASGYASLPLSSKTFSSSSSSFKMSVAAVESDQLTPEKQESAKYHFLVANAKFMLDEEEHFQEQLFERVRNFSERNIERDFWLVIEPKFLDNFPKITQRLGRPAVALVSTNANWIKFMKLRLDRVLYESFEASTLDEALASNPPPALDFGKPEKWSAPYPKYEFGWWESFLHKGLKESKV